MAVSIKINHHEDSLRKEFGYNIYGKPKSCHISMTVTVRTGPLIGVPQLPGQSLKLNQEPFAIDK